MVKDDYSLPRIDETGLPVWLQVVFILGFKVRLLAGRVMLEEKSKRLTAFKVDLIGFYECEPMAFRLKMHQLLFSDFLKVVWQICI